MTKHVLTLICATSLVSCMPQATPVARTSLPSTASEAQGILIQFFELLNTKQYAEADALYGGDYEQLKVFTATADSADHVALWSWSCENAGLQCLRVRTATLKLQTGDQYLFSVEFSDANGNLFVVGPCCGSNETESPSVSQFDYHVRNANGKFLVIDLPPYVP